MRMSVSEMFDRIERSNASMTVLRSAYKAAEEGVKDAKNQRLPDINAGLNVSYIGDAFLTDRDFSGFTRTESPHFGNGFTLDAQQVVYAGGAVSAEVDLAEQQSGMAALQIDRTRQGLRMMVVGQYLDLYRTANDIKVYEKNISLTQKLIDEIQRKREQGLALANDVTRYELRLENLKLELVQLNNTAQVLNYRLCNSLGLPDGTVIVPSSEAVMTECIGVDSFHAWQSDAMNSSPEVKISSLESDIARSRYRLARSGRLPQIAVVASESFNGPITFEVPPIDKNLNIWYVGLGIKYSLSSLYKSGKKIRQTEIAARQAVQAENVTEENLKNDVYQAYTLWQQSYVELEAKRKSLQLASENYERVHDRYIESLALVTDMLDAFNEQLSAELGVSDAEAEIFYRLCRLKYVSGIL